jgi:hypothetical protein
MMKIREIPFIARRRRRATASPVPPVLPLALLSATITALSRRDMVVSLAFDNNADDPIAPLPEGVASEWTATYGGTLYVGTAIEIVSATTLTLTLLADGESGSPNGISYDPQEPAYIETENGRVLGALANVPFEQ